MNGVIKEGTEVVYLIVVGSRHVVVGVDRLWIRRHATVRLECVIPSVMNPNLLGLDAVLGHGREGLFQIPRIPLAWHGWDGKDDVMLGFSSQAVIL